MAAKINCIDVEQNYVSVTLHVLQVQSFDNCDQGRSQGVSWNPPLSNPTKNINDKTCTHYACTAHYAARTMNVLNELRIT